MEETFAKFFWWVFLWASYWAAKNEVNHYVNHYIMKENSWLAENKIKKLVGKQG